MDEIAEPPTGPPETRLDVEKQTRASVWLGILEAFAVLIACVATIVASSEGQLGPPDLSEEADRIRVRA